MAGDFSYGQNFMVGNNYYASDGTKFDNRSARDMYEQGRLGLQRFTGPQQPHMALPGGGGGGNAGMAGNLGGAYAGAFNAARNANESRYNDILGGYEALLGGSGGGGKNIRDNINLITTAGPVNAWKNSGSSLSFSEWRALQKKLEQTAASRGGVYGAIDASGVYPRMYGQGEFLGLPSNQMSTPGGQYGQRPSVPPPVYPTYTPPVRQNVNY